MHTRDFEHLLHSAEHLFFANDYLQAHQVLSRLLAEQRKHTRANELMGLILARSQHISQALKHFEIACNGADCSSEALYHYGTLLFQTGKSDKAVRLLKKAVVKAPEHFAAQHDLALALAQSGRHQEALGAFSRAAALKDDSAELHFNTAHLHELLGDAEAALSAYAKALDINPQFALAWANRADLLAANGQHDEALAHYDQAIKIERTLADAWSNKGNLLSHLRRFDEAIAHYKTAITLNPRHFVAQSNLGTILFRLNRLDEALEAHVGAIEINPAYGRAWTGKGLVLHDRQQHADALRHFDHAIALDKRDDDARWSKARTQLITGDFAQGWANHEYRWCKSPHEARPYKTIARLNSLQQAKGKRILIWSEQGYGDTLQFCRYIPLVAELGAQVTFAVQSGLLRLLGAQFDARLISKSTPVNEADFDFQIPLLSLPLLFASDETTLPCETPYLVSHEQLLADWKPRIDFATDRPNIAIAFSGNPEQSEDVRRSMPLSALLPLLPLCRLHIAQKDVRPEDRATLAAHPDIRDLSGTILDFADTAAIISHMDAVISVDSALAHLAGALNRPLLLMLAFTPDWRWLTVRADCPWYPSAKLFRQPSPGAWSAVIDRLSAELKNLAAPRL